MLEDGQNPRPSGRGVVNFQREHKVEQEVSRTYHWPDMEVKVDGVVLVQWSDEEPDRHYLTLGAGGLRLITPGWRALFIEAPTWE